MCILYCGCINLFGNVWVVVCGLFWQPFGCFGNTCTCVYCVLYCLVYVYLFLLVLSVLVIYYCHRVTKHLFAVSK